MNHFIELNAEAWRSPRRRYIVRSTAQALACAPKSEVDVFADLQGAFRCSGGLATADAISLMLREHFDQPISRVARWIVNREVLSFAMCSQRWLPLFQFARTTMTLQPGVSPVIDELRTTFNELALVEWFVKPNASLGGATPASMLNSNAIAVWTAARSSRLGAGA